MRKPAAGLAGKPGRTLRRYLAREVARAFLGGLAIFTFVLLVARILDLIDLVIARGVPGTKVLALFAYILPSFLELTIPMALLLGVVVAIGRMTSDGELLAIRAAGVNLVSVVPPIAAVAVLVGGATLAMAMHGRPWANRQIKHTLYEIAQTRATAALRPRVFNTDFGGMVIYVDAIEADSGLMRGIMMADDREDEKTRTIFSSAGRVVANEDERTVYLQLLDGTSVSHDATQASYDKTDFDSLEVNLDLGRSLGGDVVSRGSPPGSAPRELSWSRLLGARRDKLAGGESAIEEEIEIHVKFVLAGATVLLALIGVPLGMRRARSVRARGMAVSVIVILAYYVALSGAMMIVRREGVITPLALWLPNVALAAVTATMLARMPSVRR